MGLGGRPYLIEKTWNGGEAGLLVSRRPIFRVKVLILRGVRVDRVWRNVIESWLRRGVERAEEVAPEPVRVHMLNVTIVVNRRQGKSGFCGLVMAMEGRAG